MPTSLRPSRAPQRVTLILGIAAAATAGVLATVFLIAPALRADASDRISETFERTITTTTDDLLDDAAADARTARQDAENAAAAALSLTNDVAAAGVEAPAATVIDTTALSDHINELAAGEADPTLLLPAATASASTETVRVFAAVGVGRATLAVAVADKAAQEAAAAAEAEAAAVEAAAFANTVEGAKATASSLASSEYGWGSDQFSCLVSLWDRESGWNYQAYNASSGATGIPQALPGSKMASAGADWQTNATTQIVWGLGYIAAVYGTPCGAWSHSESYNWY